MKTYNDLTIEDFDRIDFVKRAIRAALNRNLEAWGVSLFVGSNSEGIEITHQEYQGSGLTDSVYQEYCKYDAILKMDDITIYNKFVNSQNEQTVPRVP